MSTVAVAGSTVAGSAVAGSAVAGSAVSGMGLLIVDCCHDAVVVVTIHKL